MQSGRRELDVALGVVELHGDVAGLVRDPVELVDEVHVPGRAPEFAVGRGLQADLLLLADDVADRVVLDRPQLVVVDAPRGEIVARGQQALRPKQAAHMVGAEGRLRALPGAGARLLK